jgi:hypothetical protein
MSYKPVPRLRGGFFLPEMDSNLPKPAYRLFTISWTVFYKKPGRMGQVIRI